jgi:hypothetical protein
MRQLIAGIAWVSLAASVQAADRVAVPGGTITVELATDSPALDRSALLDWVRNSARAVAAFYGHFPIAETRLVVALKGGRGVSGGRTWAEGGGLIRIRVGEASTPEDYANDWVLVHEMTHLALPSLPEDQEWLEEGLATYVEPLARVQAGEMSAEAAWSGMVQGIQKGFRKPAIAGSIARIHGDARIGVVRFFACWRTSRSDSAPRTATACRTRCARSSQAATWKRRPKSSRYLRSAIAPWECQCSPNSTVT